MRQMPSRSFVFGPNDERFGTPLFPNRVCEVSRSEFPDTHRPMLCCLLLTLTRNGLRET
jgi:hypothetical protein